MGYIRTHTGRLVCDRCVTADGTVRKRTCPFKVTHDGITLPYCSPPALCKACYGLLGPAKVLHASCEAGALQSQAEEDARQAKLAAGQHRIFVRYGSSEPTVPAGEVGCGYRNRDGAEVWVLVPKASNDVDWLEDLAEYYFWEGPLSRTKRVDL